MAHAWATRRGDAPRLEAATVDHGLRRRERRRGASRRRAVREARHSPITRFSGSGAKPKTRLQERAREARYALLDAMRASDRRRRDRHRPSPRRSGGDGAVSPDARLGRQRARGMSGAVADLDGVVARAPAARLRQARSRRLLPRERAFPSRATPPMTIRAMRAPACARSPERSRPKGSTPPRSPASPAAPARSRRRSLARPKPPKRACA